VEALNYGVDPLFSQLGSRLEFREDIVELLRIWDSSLLCDFGYSLFGSSHSQDYVLRLIRTHFDFKRGSFELYMHSEELHLLLDVLIDYPEAYARAKATFPHSYFIRQLKDLIESVTENIKKNPPKDTRKFDVIGKADVFKIIFGMFFLYEYWHCQAEKDPTFIFNPDKLRLENNFVNKFISSLFGREQYIPTQTTGKTKFLHSDPLLSRLQMNLAPYNLLRAEFLQTVGVHESEVDSLKEIPSGHLDDLKASNLRKLFHIEFTHKPFEHLTISGSHCKRIIKILAMSQIFYLYHPQRIGLTR
jgi:hypothetical protein